MMHHVCLACNGKGTYQKRAYGRRGGWSGPLNCQRCGGSGYVDAATHDQQVGLLLSGEWSLKEPEMRQAIRRELFRGVHGTYWLHVNPVAGEWNFEIQHANGPTFACGYGGPTREAAFLKMLKIAHGYAREVRPATSVLGAPPPPLAGGPIEIAEDELVRRMRQLSPACPSAECVGCERVAECER